jgi:hypothetical protein
MSDKTFRTCRFHNGDQFVCVLAREGRTRLHITYIASSGIEHRSIPKTDSLYLQPLPHPDGRMIPKGYPIQRMVRRFAAIGRERGITESAKAELARARAE